MRDRGYTPYIRCIHDQEACPNGNSAALIIDRPILDLLNVGMETPLEITTDGRNIVISPAMTHTEDEFLASLDKINARFSTTLERAAK